MSREDDSLRSALLDDYLPEFPDATARLLCGDGVKGSVVTSRGPRGWKLSADGDVVREEPLPTYNENLDDEDKAPIVLEAIRQYLHHGSALPTVHFFDPQTAYPAHRCLGRAGRADLIQFHAYSTIPTARVGGYYRDCLPPILRWLDSGDAEQLPPYCFDRFEVFSTMEDCSEIVASMLERLLRRGAEALANDIPSSLISIMEFHRVPEALFRRVWEEIMVPKFAEDCFPRTDLFTTLLASRYLQDAKLSEVIAPLNPIEPRAWKAIVQSFIESPPPLPRRPTP